MHRVQRVALDAATQKYLTKRQADADAKLQLGSLNPTDHWKASRQTKSMEPVLATLQAMMGKQQRCMYCVDSHGCDIEHFRPKADFQGWIYLWNNLLLCCTECGRFKGNRFPMQDGQPLLLDPAIDEPWQYLDFDPTTGNITARWDSATTGFQIKGETTVAVLQLDQREALAVGYQKTWRRLSKRIAHFLEAPIAADAFIADLLEHDDHGLLGWFFKGNGQTEAPLVQLREQHAPVWQACAKAFEFQ